MKGYKLSEEMVRAVRAVIKDYQNERQFSTSKKGYKRERAQQEDIVQVKCTVAIPAATDSFATPSTSGKAKFQVSDSSGVLSDYSPEIEVEVINHSESDSWAVDDYLKIHFIDGKWHPYSGGGGGAATPSTCTCCAGIAEGDIAHPHLPTGSNLTSSSWTLKSGCGETLSAMTVSSSDGKGTVTWTPTTNPVLVRDAADDIFKYTITTGLTAATHAGTDVTGTTTFSASIAMDWSVTPNRVRISLDGTLP